MKKVLVFALSMALSSQLWAAAAAGSCEDKATTLKATQVITLVDEWDPDFKENTGLGVYYAKIAIPKWSTYSIWIEGGDATNLSFSVETSFDSDDYTSFGDSGDVQDGALQYARLARDDWDEEDPSKVTFYVCVTGEIGEKTTLKSSPGYLSFVPVGAEENAQPLTFRDQAQTFTSSFVEGEYYFTAKLSKDRIYRVRTVGGTNGNKFDLDVDDVPYVVDPLYANDTNNTAFILMPTETKTSTLQIEDAGASTQFSFVYQSLPVRAVTAHPVVTLSAANGYATSFVAGREMATWDYGDRIVDDNLCAVTLAKGQRVAFETRDASEALHMNLYDSKGNLLAENTTCDGVSHDLRIAFQAPLAGTYYVGVFNPELAPYDAVTGSPIQLRMRFVDEVIAVQDAWDAQDDETAGASGLEVLPASAIVNVFADGTPHGPHTLSLTDWSDTFVIAGRKGLTYRVGVEFADPTDTSKFSLSAKVFTLSGTTEKEILLREIYPLGKEDFEFQASAHAAYYIRFQVAEGAGLDFPPYVVKALARSTTGEQLGVLKVTTFGAPQGTFSLDAETVKYPSGSSLLVSGTHTIKFGTATGFKAPASQRVTVAPGAVPTDVVAYYSDTFDPKDDTFKMPTALTLKNTQTLLARTLWSEDEADHFSFAATDGYFYDFALTDVTGDAVFTITNAVHGVIVENVTNVTHLALAKTTPKYILIVSHGSAAKVDGSYQLASKFANVGAIKLAKNAVSVKENAGQVVLTVNRTAKDGRVRVRYGTVADTAKPGVDYEAQTGTLVWEANDNKAKTITIPIIPNLVASYQGDRRFALKLESLEETELEANEYRASLTGGDTCTITISEVSRVGTTVESTYATKAPKLATVKTENVPLETGTFFGVIQEDGWSLTNTFPRMASVSLTASTAKPSALSAKVALGGKTYTFSAKGWDEQDELTATKRFELVQRTLNVSYTNVLTVTMTTGSTTNGTAFLAQEAQVTLQMNVPDTKGVQEDIWYTGTLYRNNAKIQEYLSCVTNFTGYYTVALVPEGVSEYDGVPAGNGYLTLTVDNKGTVKVAGQLADGVTKPSLSVAACALVQEPYSASGYALCVPIYFAKNPACLAGTVRLYVDDQGARVVDSFEPLTWSTDKAADTYDGEQGFCLDLSPVGGFYDQLINLQAYYQNRAVRVETNEVEDFPTEALTSGFDYVLGVNGTAVDVVGDAFATAKKTLVKKGKLNDLDLSVNPCNVQVKLARATGVITGTFSVWTASDAAQKEITGLKHYGALILSRDALSPLSSDVLSAGFFIQPLKLSTYNDATKRTTTRTWNCSRAFNLIGEDLGERDPWENDWGTNQD